MRQARLHPAVAAPRARAVATRHFSSQGRAAAPPHGSMLLPVWQCAAEAEVLYPTRSPMRAQARARTSHHDASLRHSVFISM